MTDDAALWLDDDERATWLVLAALMTRLPAAMDACSQHDDGLTFFEYTVLAVLSESDDRTMLMSELAFLAHGSLSRLSHVVRRLEAQGFIRRRRRPCDRRSTEATLTDLGMAKVEQAAPRHVAAVRSLVFDVTTTEQQHGLRRAALRILVGIAPESPQVLADHGVCLDQVTDVEDLSRPR